MPDFEERLFNVESSMCVVAFAAATQTVFQFGRLLGQLQLPHVLIRDSLAHWYQFGVRGIGDRPTVVAYLRELAHKYYVKTVGVSSGSYGALLYGQLAEVNEIIAISPLTTGTAIDDLPPHWHCRVRPPPDEPLFPIEDLLPHYAGGPKARTRIYVSNGNGTELDDHMGRRLGIEPILIPGYSHSDLAKGMRDIGVLGALLRERA